MRSVRVLLASAWLAMGLAACGDALTPSEEELATPEEAGATPEAAPATPEAASALLAASQSAPGQGGIHASLCATCHGVSGEGRPDLKSPAIAGLPAWYVVEQIGKFRSGARGYHAEDLAGQTMRVISIGLTESQIDEAASTVAALPAIPTEEAPEPFDLERARYRYANGCMECHRYNGRGEIAFHSPPLVSLDRAYLLRQMTHYREGLRGGAPGDLYGAKMREICGKLDDAEIALFVDYLGALARGDDPRPYRER